MTTDRPIRDSIIKARASRTKTPTTEKDLVGDCLTEAGALLDEAEQLSSRTDVLKKIQNCIKAVALVQRAQKEMQRRQTTD
jgi:hypothetical protein